MTDPIDLGPLPEPYASLEGYDARSIWFQPNVPPSLLTAQPLYTADQLRAERQRAYALGREHAPGAAWLRAIDEAMVTHHVGVADPSDDYETAKRKLNALLCVAQSIGEYFAKQDAERYRWLRDKGSDTWRPFVNQWHMDAALCDAAIDNEMAKPGQFGAA